MRLTQRKHVHLRLLRLHHQLFMFYQYFDYRWQLNKVVIGQSLSCDSNTDLWLVSWWSNGDNGTEMNMKYLLHNDQLISDQHLIKLFNRLWCQDNDSHSSSLWSIPAHNIQIFSHRFSSEFCISFKHKLITSALIVHSFLFAPLLQCCGILLKLLTMEQSFRDWNETLHMISFLTTFTSLLASPAPLIPSSPGEECAT